MGGTSGSQVVHRGGWSPTKGSESLTNKSGKVTQESFLWGVPGARCGARCGARQVLADCAEDKCPSGVDLRARDDFSRCFRPAENLWLGPDGSFSLSFPFLIWLLCVRTNGAGLRAHYWRQAQPGNSTLSPLRLEKNTCNVCKSVLYVDPINDIAKREGLREGWRERERERERKQLKI